MCVRARVCVIACTRAVRAGGRYKLSLMASMEHVIRGSTERTSPTEGVWGTYKGMVLQQGAACAFCSRCAASVSRGVAAKEAWRRIGLIKLLVVPMSPKMHERRGGSGAGMGGDGGRGLSKVAGAAVQHQSPYIRRAHHAL